MPPTTAPDLSQFKRAGAPDLSQFKKGAVKKAFRFDVPKEEVSRETKVAGYQADAAKAAEESKKANSVGGFLSNFGKDFVSRVASAEVGLGKTIAKTIDKTPEKAAKNIADLQNSQVSLIKQIRDKTAKGEDTTKLKSIYNSNQDLIDENQGEIQGYAASLPTTLEAVGQLGGTALDILSAGTYGKAAAGMKTGELAGKVTQAALPGAVKAVTPVGKATGLFSKSGAGRVATGAGLGYASDVTQGLMGNRGEDREGAKALIPGAGTLIGAAIPTALEAEKTVKNVTSGLVKEQAAQKFVAKREKAFQDLIDRGVKTKKLDSNITSKGRNISEVLASDDRFVPEVNGGIINSDNAINKIQEQADPMAQFVRAVVESEGRRVSVDDFQKQAIDQIGDLKLRGDEYTRVKNNIMADMDFYRSNYADESGTIPLEVIDDIKKAKYGEVNWANPDLYTADRAISRSARRTIEDNTPGDMVKNMNDELGKLYDAQEMLEALNGRGVKGARLGKYFARGIGAGIGAAGGPITSVIGMIGADKLADIQQSAYFQNPAVKAWVGAQEAASPAIFAEAQDLIAKRAAGIPTGSSILLPEGAIRMPAPAAKDSTKVFSNYDDFLGAQGIERAAPDMAALPPARPGVPEGGSLPIEIPSKLPSAVDAAEAARRASGDIRTNGGGIADAPAEKQAQFVAETIQKHLRSAAQVVKNLDQLEFEKLGGTPELLNRTRTNIADALAQDGLAAMADAIRAVTINETDTLAKFFDKTMNVLIGNVVE